MTQLQFRQLPEEYRSAIDQIIEEVLGVGAPDMNDAFRTWQAEMFDVQDWSRPNPKTLEFEVLGFRAGWQTGAAQQKAALLEFRDYAREKYPQLSEEMVTMITDLIEVERRNGYHDYRSHRAGKSQIGDAMKSDATGKLAQKKFYTTNDAAKLIGVSKVTIIRYIEKGKIEALRLPGIKAQYRIRAEKFQLFMNKRKVF